MRAVLTFFSCKTKDLSVGSKSNLEFCPSCRNVIDGSSEKIIIGGKEWHKNCYDRENQRDVKVVAKRNTEVCPGCQAEIEAGECKYRDV